MGERVLPTVQALREIARKQSEREGELTVKPLETRTPKPKIMIRGREQRRVQLIGSPGLVGSNNKFLLC